MARLTVKVPKLGLTIESVKLTEWLKSIGDDVAAGEVIAAIEADKATFEIEAPAAGTLVEQLVPADDDEEIAVGEAIAVIQLS
jgi:pyruvate/2-oxoglutarate dehydrogenase complex dihydrolipoamide acyltransferase (E2) component